MSKTTDTTGAPLPNNTKLAENPKQRAKRLASEKCAKEQKEALEKMKASITEEQAFAERLARALNAVFDGAHSPDLMKLFDKEVSLQYPTKHIDAESINLLGLLNACIAAHSSASTVTCELAIVTRASGDISFSVLDRRPRA